MKVFLSTSHPLFKPSFLMTRRRFFLCLGLEMISIRIPKSRWVPSLSACLKIEDHLPGLRRRLPEPALGHRAVIRVHLDAKKLRVYLGRVVRDVERKCNGIPGALNEELEKARRLLRQQRSDSHKLYSLHEPQVECIAKGKAHKRYEFGCKAGLVTSAKTNWILGARAFHGNPYDGHTLGAALAQAARLTGVIIKQAACDLGYRGHDATDGACDVQIVRRRRKGVPKAVRYWWKRRSALSPVIGHVKAEHRIERNRLGGTIGDKLNAILSACGFNLRKLLRGFGAILRFLRWAWAILGAVPATLEEDWAQAA
jgi:IS5 family transposase